MYLYFQRKNCFFLFSANICIVFSFFPQCLHLGCIERLVCFSYLIQNLFFSLRSPHIGLIFVLYYHCTKDSGLWGVMMFCYIRRTHPYRAAPTTLRCRLLSRKSNVLFVDNLTRRAISRSIFHLHFGTNKHTITSTQPTRTCCLRTLVYVDLAEQHIG